MNSKFLLQAYPCLLTFARLRFVVLALTTVGSTLLIGSTTAALAAIYKTNSNQVVVTGLQRQTKYSVQTTNFSGRNSNRTVITNSCGEALISNGTGYRRLTINKQTITPSSLPTQTHPRCNLRRNSSVINTQQQLHQ